MVGYMMPRILEIPSMTGIYIPPNTFITQNTLMMPIVHSSLLNAQLLLHLRELNILNNSHRFHGRRSGCYHRSNPTAATNCLGDLWNFQVVVRITRWSAADECLPSIMPIRPSIVRTIRRDLCDSVLPCLMRLTVTVNYCAVQFLILLVLQKTMLCNI
jgi:hypothetical protein